VKDEYLMAKLHRVLSEDGSELGIEAIRRNDAIVVRGEVETEERRRAVEAKVREQCPEFKVHNEITVSRVTKPVEPETLLARDAGGGDR
jgi:hypothetical protein